MYKKNLSSLLTFLHRFINPIVMVYVFLFLAREVYRQPGALPAPLFLMVALIAIGCLSMTLWFAYQVKKVSIDGEFIIVSDYFKEIRVPLRDVYDVTEMRWMQPYWITLHFRRSTEFGDSVIFVPPFRFLSFWVANPLVEEIRSLASSHNRPSWR